MKRIEITGLPGSGKSTLLPLIKDGFKELGAILTEKDLVDRLIKKKYFMFSPIFRLLTMSFRNKLFNKLYKFNIKSNKLEPKYIQLLSFINDLNSQRRISNNEAVKIMSWFYNLISVMSLAEKFIHKQEYFLIDESFVHRAQSLFISKEEPVLGKEMLKKYLKQ